ncbi:MAG: hypothetical protein QFB87_03180 [Patescibacteria group bacterium]|nr:hypothetical protein [Patescibacteria group bacterium]
MAHPMKTAKRIAASAAVAGAAGYLAGLLTAPKSGKATREEFLKAAGKNASDMEAQLNTLHTELGNLVDEAKGKGDDLGSKAQKELRKLVDLSKDSKDKTATVLSALKNGKASDKDLKKAMADAKHAIDHIKDYLKK